MRPEKLNYILSSISSLKGVGPKLEQIINTYLKDNFSNKTIQ